jgi:putative membrane protein
VHSAPSLPPGQEPDHRFTFANERTFLAWIRTALALDAAGLAVIGFLPPSSMPFAREALAVALLGLGTVIAGASLRQWERNQAALRLDGPIPRSPLLRVLAGGVVTAAALALLLALTATSE